MMPARPDTTCRYGRPAKANELSRNGIAYQSFPLWTSNNKHDNMTDRQSFLSGVMCSVVGNSAQSDPGGLRGPDVKYREGGAAPGRWISTCSELLILRVICPLNLHPHLSRVAADESAGPQTTSPAPVAWLPSSRDVAA